jgi:hypothetical protein
VRLCSLLVLAGCSNPFGQCAGSLTGGFDGAGGGTISATLTDDGDLRLFLLDDDGEELLSIELPVEEDGNIETPDGQSIRIDGEMDLEACTAAGTWASLDGNGSWSIAQ